MNIKIEKFSEENAMDVCSWKYEFPYSIYNLPEWDVCQERNLGITKPILREKEFRSLYDEGILMGYFRVSENKEYLNLGVGLRLKYCGCGYSNIVFPMILKFIKQNYKNKCIRLVVRNFNKRAIKVYSKFGFYEKGEILVSTPNGDEICKVMMNSSYIEML